MTRVIIIVPPACVFLLLLFDVSVCGDECGSASDTPSRSLRRHLMCGYDKSQRPVINKADTVNLTILLWLSYIQIDEFSNSIDVFTFTILNWQDQFLTWDPLLYDNENEFLVHPSTIWTPTLALARENRVRGTPTLLTTPRTLCMLNSTGNLHCLCPTIFRAPCEYHERRWPFGTNKCRLYVDQWDDQGDKVNFTLHKPKIIESVMSDLTWALISYDASMTSQTSELGIIHRVVYTFVLRRQWTLTTTFIFMSALTAIFLTVLPFTMHHSHRGRLSVVLGDLVLHVGTIQTLGFLVDHTISRLPYIVIYFTVSLIMASISLVLTVFWKVPVSGVARFFPVVKISQELDKYLTVFRLKSQTGEEQQQEEEADEANSLQRIIRVMDFIFLIIFVITYVVLSAQFIP